MYQKIFRGITFVNAFIGNPHARLTNNTTVFDFDGTIILSDKSANLPVIAEAIRLKAEGYMLILSTARGDKRWKGSWSKDKIEIIAKEIAEDLHNIGLHSLFDEVHIGMKAYSNHFYMDDKSAHTSAIKSKAGACYIAYGLIFQSRLHFELALAGNIQACILPYIGSCSVKHFSGYKTSSMERAWVYLGKECIAIFESRKEAYIAEVTMLSAVRDNS